jgi:hypothetical protein
MAKPHKGFAIISSLKNVNVMLSAHKNILSNYETPSFVMHFLDFLAIQESQPLLKLKLILNSFATCTG